MSLKSFLSLAYLFEKQGFQLWLVGGTVRDYLLGRPMSDMDAVTNATPQQMKLFLTHADDRFSHYGLIKLVHESYTFEITTLRQEKDYRDFRHPSTIQFVKTPKEDVLRRDFTMNGLYMNGDQEVLDYVQGKEAIRRKIIQTIGDPYVRFSEDPLRLLRALRFILQLDFTLEKQTEQALHDSIDLLTQLKPQKIEQEIKKIGALRHPKTEALLTLFQVPQQYYRSMLK